MIPLKNCRLKCPFLKCYLLIMLIHLHHPQFIAFSVHHLQFYIPTIYKSHQNFIFSLQTYRTRPYLDPVVCSDHRWGESTEKIPVMFWFKKRGRVVDYFFIKILSRNFRKQHSTGVCEQSSKLTGSWWMQRNTLVQLLLNVQKFSISQMPGRCLKLDSGLN